MERLSTDVMNTNGSGSNSSVIPAHEGTFSDVEMGNKVTAPVG